MALVIYHSINLAWVHDNIRPEQLNIKNAKVPLYSEVVDSLADFKKT